ncbi:unnamed protein product [Symbiodinium pilosum]|uniref:Uncharacterized protein n=1 Tax=Symbiodinium pilosum TaxID=2952 RepID=A0A812RF45_SYMPI|nr:unnamed protein product [Symbiodinium pilosum]
MDEARDDFALAACLGRIDTVRSLLDAGMRADTLVCDHKSMTMLMVARLRGQVDVVELLIERDAALDTVWRPYSRTVLQLASRLSHLSVAKLLLCKRADPHLLDVRGRTALMIEGMRALMWACAGAHVDIARELLVAGAVVNALDEKGMTALMYTAANGSLSTVR